MCPVYIWRHGQVTCRLWHGGTLAVGADQITVLATCAQTNDTLFAVEVRMSPGGGPPVMHRHAPGEIYYVTGGEFIFYIADEHGSVQRIPGWCGRCGATRRWHAPHRPQ